MAASNATHAFATRAEHVYTQASATGLPGSFVPPASVPSSQHLQGLQSQPQPSAPPLDTSSGSSYNHGSVPINILQCFICDKSWQYHDQASKADCQMERATHMDLVHDTPLQHAHNVLRTTIKIVEDDNVGQLTEGRWLPFPSDIPLLCKKIPKKIQPLNLGIDLTVVNLPLASKKPLELLYNRLDNSMPLKMFARDRLLSHEKLKRRKLDFVSSTSDSSVVWDDCIEDLKSNFEALQSVINYVTLTSFVDVCDKSPLCLLHVALEMFSVKSLTPSTAEKLFAVFLTLKTSAAAQGKPFPSVHDIKNAVAHLNVPANPPSKASTTSTAKSKSSTTKKQKSGGGQRFCHDYNNSGCSRSQGVSCKLGGLTYLHGCNKKQNGVYCGLSHPRNDCPK